MKIYKHEIPDILIFEPQLHEDNRGFFFEFYNLREFEDKGIIEHFVQDNFSFSHKNVLRGLHFQIRCAQGKLITVISGKVYDVAVDLRQNSATLGKWVSTYLSSEDRMLLWIPPGFAHGYYTISDQAEVLYKVTDYYSPKFERTLVWNDPDINVNWPLPNSQMPLLSEKDSNGRFFHELDKFEF